MLLFEYFVGAYFFVGVLALIILRFRREGKVVNASFWTLVLIPFVITFCAHQVLLFGWINFLIYIALVILWPSIGEILALKTGFVGAYSYQDTPGPRVKGLPFSVILMWGLILVMSGWVTLALLQIINPDLDGTARFLFYIFVTPTVATAFDLLMDPVMTRQGHWRWDGEGAWYGIPTMNFIGWFVFSFMAVTSFALLGDPYIAMKSMLFSPFIHWIYGWVFLLLIIELTLNAISLRLHGSIIIGILLGLLIGASLSWLTFVI